MNRDSSSLATQSSHGKRIIMDDREDDTRQIGALLTGIGGLCYVVSIIAFSRTGMLVSNIAFFAGVFIILGLNRTRRLLVGEKRITASALLVGGFIAIALDRRVSGLLAQLSGAFLLFGGFLPILLNKAKRLPVVGPYVRVALPAFVYQMNSHDESLT